MPAPTRKGIFILLLVAVLTILMSFIPNMLSADADAWFKAYFGDGYRPYLVALLPFCAVVLVLLTTDVGKYLIPGTKTRSIDLPPDAPDPDLVAKVRKYLLSRYTHRLSQKLAGRQPVNLRILPSNTGTSKEGAENYITLQEELDDVPLVFRLTVGAVSGLIDGFTTGLTVGLLTWLILSRHFMQTIEIQKGVRIGFEDLLNGYPGWIRLCWKS